MTTSRAPFADPTLIAAMCAGFILVLTACTDERARTGAETPPAEADFNAGVAAYKQDDYATALREWRPLAAQNHAAAQANLGFMYYNGEGVPQDYAEAVRWYRKAAAQGYARAQVVLGTMYELGRDVPHDHIQAHTWFNLAASSFPPGKDRDKAVEHRDIVAATMTPAQMTEAQKLAREWKPK